MNKYRISYYFDPRKTTYFSLLKSSGKLRELYSETESKISICIAITATVTLYFGFGTRLDCAFNELMRNISLDIAVALIGLLGFMISGLAIFTGTLTNELVKKLDDDSKGPNIINIFYSFYFIGGIDAFEVLILIVVFFLSYIDKPFCIPVVYTMFLLTTYLFVFILLYSVSLIGTCIRIFLVRYKYGSEDQNEGS